MGGERETTIEPCIDETGATQSLILRLRELNKKPGVCYAFTNDGLELPVADVSRPAFALRVIDSEQRRLVEALREGPSTSQIGERGALFSVPCLPAWLGPCGPPFLDLKLDACPASTPLLERGPWTCSETLMQKRSVFCLTLPI